MALKTGNVVQAKFGTIARTDTTDTLVFNLPSNAMVIGVRAFGTNSNAGTSATLTFKSQPQDGSTSAATFATVDAKATSGGATQATLTGIAYNRQSTHTIVTCAYSETGAASSAGGDWSVAVEYV